MGKSREVARLPNAPAFSAYAGAVTSIPATTGGKVQFNTEEFDTNSNYDHSTGRFTPTVAGYYLISASVQFSDTGLATPSCTLAKNGTAYKLGNYMAVSTDYPIVQVSAIVYLNGSTDYVEINAAHGKGSAVNTFASATNTWIQGVLVRTA